MDEILKCGHSNESCVVLFNSDFKQITTEGATMATVTKGDWREYMYIREHSSNSKLKMQSCMQNGIDR